MGKSSILRFTASPVASGNISGLCQPKDHCAVPLEPETWCPLPVRQSRTGSSGPAGQQTIRRTICSNPAAPVAQGTSRPCRPDACAAGMRLAALHDVLTRLMGAQAEWLHRLHDHARSGVPLIAADRVPKRCARHGAPLPHRPRMLRVAAFGGQNVSRRRGGGRRLSMCRRSPRLSAMPLPCQRGASGTSDKPGPRVPCHVLAARIAALQTLAGCYAQGTG